MKHVIFNYMNYFIFSVNQVLTRENLPLNKELPVNAEISMVALNILPNSSNNVQLIMCDISSDVFNHVTDQLRVDIEKYIKSLPPDDKYVPRIGELCLAKYSGNFHF